jgi:DNA-binding beta-propeller fold protein YncE
MTSTATEYLRAGDLAYEPDDGWAKLPDGFEFNEVAGVAVDASDNLYVFVRGPHPVIVLDKDGNFRRSWGEGFYGGRAHGIHVAPDGAVYCVENTRHAIEKYTQDGEHAWTLGEAGRPAPKWSGKPFNLPTHMAVSPKTGDIFVGDGYGNNCVHRFSPDGRLLATWGTHGCEPGEFQCPHNLAVDEDEFVYVADRENNRVQVFDGYGNLEAIWRDVYRPSGICYDRGLIYVGELLHDPHPLLADCTEMGHRLSIFTKHGRRVARLGSPVEGDGPGEFIAPHAVAVDSKGNVYVGEVSYTEKGRRQDPPKVYRSLRKLRKVS